MRLETTTVADMELQHMQDIVVLDTSRRSRAIERGLQQHQAEAGVGDQVNGLEAEVQQLYSALYESRAEEESMADRLERVMEAFDQVLVEKAEVEENLSRTQAELQESENLRMENSQLQSQIRKAQEDVESLALVLDETNAAICSGEDGGNEKRRAFQDQVLVVEKMNSLKEQVLSNKVEMANYEAKSSRLVQLEGKYLRKKTKIRELQIALETQKAEFLTCSQTGHQELLNLHNQLSELQSSLETTNQQNSDLQNQYTDLESQYLVAEGKVKGRNEELDTMRSDLANVETKLARAEGQLAAAVDRLRDREDRHHRLIAEHRTLLDAVRSHSSEGDPERQISKLRSENSTLQASLAGLQATHRDCHRQKDEIISQLARLQSDNERLQDALMEQVNSLDSTTRPKSSIQGGKSKVKVAETLVPSLEAVLFCFEDGSFTCPDRRSQGIRVFKQIVRGIRGNNPSAYIGLLTHNSLQHVVIRQELKRVTRSTENLIDGITSTIGFPEWILALERAKSMLNTFKEQHRGRACRSRIICIGGGPYWAFTHRVQHCTPDNSSRERLLQLCDDFKRDGIAVHTVHCMLDLDFCSSQTLILGVSLEAEGRIFLSKANTSAKLDYEELVGPSQQSS